ncbi:MAG: transcription initiation protein [Chitinophaga sp.]|uniref:YciI family protein n=1 Tax=Chitinophaga sp. TaxID=1869181 RepID=UPI001B1F0ED9|nr:YciI family protein [Chitinophaga sp.]MBO9729894.1 transcription initiation protein [Chitinophaga sp.]
MTEFAYFYRGYERPASPEEMQQKTAKWMAWLKDLSDKGYVKSLGEPLQAGGKVIRGAKKQVVDGPYAEAKDVVGGYSIILASDLEEAVKFSLGCPIFEDGGSVEVRAIGQPG